MNVDHGVRNSIYRTGRIASRFRLDRARLTTAPGTKERELNCIFVKRKNSRGRKYSPFLPGYALSSGF
jgi:hypothetical protein